MRSSWLMLVAVGAIGALSAPARAAESKVWSESPGFLVTSAGADTACAEVFHSPNYHQLLVLPDRGDQAYVLGVSTRSVNAIPRSDVTLSTAGAILAENLKAQPYDAFERRGAEISFRCGDVQMLLSPAKPLVGETRLATLLARKQEYAASAAAYKPDPEAIKRIRACARPTEIIVFFGTWCDVCAQRMPAFIKIIETAGNPNLRVRYISVAAQFSEPRELIQQYRVALTPTFVVLQGGAEIGRIDKAPSPTIERMLADILGGSR